MLKSTMVAECRVPDVFRQPPLLSGSLLQRRSLQLHVFLLLVLPPFLLQVWICREEQLLPGAPGGLGGRAPTSKHQGLLALSTHTELR